MGEIIGSSLNNAIIDLFDKRIATGILATVNQDASPHTSPVSFMIAVDPKRIRIAIFRNSQTLANIRQHDPVILAIMDEGNIAVSIRGRARVILENMESNYCYAVVELEVEEVKNDASQNFLVIQGIRTRHINEPGFLSIKKIFTELQTL